jgi:hypothetical protein
MLASAKQIVQQMHNSYLHAAPAAVDVSKDHFPAPGALQPVMLRIRFELKGSITQNTTSRRSAISVGTCLRSVLTCLRSGARAGLTTATQA